MEHLEPTRTMAAPALRAHADRVAQGEGDPRRGGDGDARPAPTEQSGGALPADAAPGHAAASIMDSGMHAEDADLAPSDFSGGVAAAQDGAGPYKIPRAPGVVPGTPHRKAPAIPKTTAPLGAARRPARGGLPMALADSGEIELEAQAQQEMQNGRRPEVSDTAQPPAAETANQRGWPSRAGRDDRIGEEEAAAPSGASGHAEGAAGRERIIGSGDRAHHLAMSHVVGAVFLIPPKLPATGRALPKLAPRSRVECGRRCGADGFCDPSSELGCGGEYCGQRHNWV